MDIDEFRDVTPTVFEKVEIIDAPEECSVLIVAKIDG